MLFIVQNKIPIVMKFIVSSSALLKQLSSINGVIVSNPVIPILDNFLFEVNDKELIITASDLQTYLTTTVPVESHGHSKLAIPAKILIETLKNLPDQPITFTIEENSYNVEITSSNGRYKLAGENSNDFPDTPEINKNSSIEMSPDILSTAISKTLFATSNDELRPSMGGVYIIYEDNKTTFVATDGHKLSRYIRTDMGSSNPFSVIVPRKPLNILTNLPIEDRSKNVTMAISNSHAYFNIGNAKVVTRLIDERYPEYENVLPKESPYQLTIQRKDFLSSLKRVAIYANKVANQIRLKMAGSELQIITEDLDFSNEAVERLTCAYEGEDLEIGFNAKFLIEGLNNIDSEEVVIHLGQPQRAVLMFPKDKDDNEDLLVLVMPVILNEMVHI